MLIAGLLVNIAFTHAGGNPRRWEILGMAVGGTIGLLAEYRYLHYVPQMTRWPQRLAMSVLGLIGIAVCFALDRLVGKEVLWIGLVSGSLAMLWAVLGAPFLFTRLGWGRTKEPPLVAHRSEAGRSER